MAEPVLGERVRLAVETLIRASSRVLERSLADAEPDRPTARDAYIAATRVIMRVVAVLFAEARALLPVDNPIYHADYGMQGLREQLERGSDGFGAWPRLLSLFRLLHDGSRRAELPITRHGGGLFRAATPTGDGVARALHAFECVDNRISDATVHRLLELLTRTQARVGEGRARAWVDVPVDFSTLASETIGVIYEGLLDYELRRAGPDDPVVFLDVGLQPALPFSRLATMSVAERRHMLDELAKSDEHEDGDGDGDDGGERGDTDAATHDGAARRWHEAIAGWARETLRDAGCTADAARRLVRRVVLPGEWFLVRCGGTRKGAGSFYTPPQLAGPTVRRCLQPLTHERVGDAWRPRTPELILNLKICDPAMGSGSFLVSALRWLTDALEQSLQLHGHRELELLSPDHDALASAGPSRRARLQRHVVERCIYGVDIDPLAVELARLALWVDTRDPTLPFEFLDHRLACGNALLGCWFDHFEGYPITAWEREGGDKQHANFAHHVRARAGTQDRSTRVGDVWTQAIARRKLEIKRALVELIEGRARPAPPDTCDCARVLQQARDAYRAVCAQQLEPELQAEQLRALRASIAPLRERFDAWCALWFWPGDALDDAPTPQTLAQPSAAARLHIAALREQHRFFHWELEFPDVFCGEAAGFDAVLGNPPWDIQKPHSKEFFANVDPLYRTLGKQQALRWQQQAFMHDAALERRWIAYQAQFKALSNWVRWAADPFGDPERDGAGKGYALARHDNAQLHRAWRELRGERAGFADPQHPFRHQGSADLNAYKLFIELGHALLRPRGRLGMIVPSGIYTDKGSATLRELLLDRCSWEWLFGFENREGVFAIHRSFKFAAVLVEKAGTTASVHAAFMRRELSEWGAAAPRTIDYPRARIAQFSPNSTAILELDSERDLAVMQKLYDNGVLLGDTGPAAWAIEYSTEFHMTNDSEHFRPRPQWEREGYVADAYGHWLKGGWTQARAPGHARVRSRDGQRDIALADIEDVALPLYEGRMIGQFDFSEKGWVSGKGRSAKWRDIPTDAKTLEPQFIVSLQAATSLLSAGPKLAFMAIASACNRRSMICSFIDTLPTSHSLGILRTLGASAQESMLRMLALSGVLNSFVFDAMLRHRLGGLNVSAFLLAEIPLPRLAPTHARLTRELARRSAALNLTHERFARTARLLRHDMGLEHWRHGWAQTHAEALRSRVILDALVAHWYGLQAEDLALLLRDCDHGVPPADADAKGFWRVDKHQPPELRHSVLVQVAFQELSRDGLDRFLDQHEGEGWMLPEQLRLADYGLGHDARAAQPQVVAARLGPRFRQRGRTQPIDASWAECERHAELLEQLLGTRP